MSDEDKDLERLKAKRLAEMEKNLSSQQKQEKIVASQKEQKAKKISPREIVIKRLGFRGLEVLQNAEYQFPKETQMVVLKLSELISSGEITEVLDGGNLLSLFRAIGIKVRMKTKINVEDDGKFVSLSDKLKKSSPTEE
jgi:DNA-binding TFAR19-related protein (PDSD5 family)|tara:strand:+ start:60 stop:476 length:417 start_codon:yes stop_codon:yes gene_type:complete